MSDPSVKYEADRLMRQGYFVTSRKFCMVARIDREDWKEYCEDRNYPINADWYRRCVSEDKITVSHGIRQYMENSCGIGIGFCSK